MITGIKPRETAIISELRVDKLIPKEVVAIQSSYIAPEMIPDEQPARVFEHNAPRSLQMISNHEVEFSHRRRANRKVRLFYACYLAILQDCDLSWTTLARIPLFSVAYKCLS